MKLHRSIAWLLPAILCGTFTILLQPTSAQSPGATVKAGSATTAAQDAERRKVLESDAWRRTQREFNEWLSVQTVYTPEQVVALQKSLNEQIATMSPRELEDFQKDMASRLDVLMSPEAEDARKWLAQFMSVAVNPEQQLGRSLPDVMNMTAGQIRQEIRWLQQKRDSRMQSRSAFDQTRAMQAGVAQQARAQREQSRQLPQDRSSWPSNTPRRPSQYAPQPELLPQPLPNYIVSPWGHPIFW